MKKNNFTKKLKELIEKSGFTQRQVAIKLGITESAMSRYLKGEREPRIDILHNLSKVFDVSLSYFDIQRKSKLPTLKDMVYRNGKDLSEEERLELIRLLSKEK